MFTLHEIFQTLQGEGTNTGKPCIFIRFSGCNLACPWCDTDFSPKMHLTLDQLLERVATFPCKNIIFTGGEPLLQPHLLDLAQALKTRGYWLAIETNGTIEPSPELRQTLDYIATSPKFGAPLNLTRADEVRLVVAEEITADWCRAIRAQLPARDYYLSPCDDGTHLHVREAIELLGELNSEFGMRNAELPGGEVEDHSMKTASTVSVPITDRSPIQARANSEFRISHSEFPWRLSLQTHKLAGIP